MFLSKDLPRFGWIICGLFWAAQVGLVAYGQAPQYLQDPVDTKLNEKALAAEKRKAMMPPGTDWSKYKDAITQYYGRIVFPRMTQIASLEQIPAIRNEYKKEIDRAITSEIRTDLLNFAKSWAPPRLKNAQYHPAVRVNAALLLAEIDESPVDTAKGEAPLPVGQFVPLYQEILADNSTANDCLRPVAIFGLSRNIKLGRDSNVRMQAAKTLFAQIEQVCPAGRDPNAHAYLQWMAFEGILHYEEISKSAAIIKRLVDAVKDETRPSLFRVRTARVFPRLPVMKDVASPYDTFVKNWKPLAVEYLEREAERLERLDKPNYTPPADIGYGGSSGYGGSPGYSSGGSESMMEGSGYGYPGAGARGGIPGAAAPAEAQPADVLLARRKINWVLESIHLALDDRPAGAANIDSGKAGLAAWLKTMPAAQSAPLAKEANETLKAISTLQGEINDPSHSTTKKYAELLRNKAKELSEVPAVEEPAAAPAPAPGPAAPNVSFNQQ